MARDLLVVAKELPKELPSVAERKGDAVFECLATYLQYERVMLVAHGLA